MNSRGGRGRGWYYKQKYGRGRGYGGEGPRDDSESYQDNDGRGNGGGRMAGGSNPASRDHHCLLETLRRIDNRGYNAYHDIQGPWNFPEFTLYIDHVQSDPYASPSRCRVTVPSPIAAFPPSLWSTRTRRTALCDFLTRSFGGVVKTSGGDVRAQSGGWQGEKGGDIEVDAPKQFVMERSSVTLHSDGTVEARFTVGLPARGRTVLGDWAAAVLVRNLPTYVNAGLKYASQDAVALSIHIDCVDDTEALRSALSPRGLVAFVGDGALLPRKTGASDAPMPITDAVPFVSPPSLAIEIDLPHQGRVRGMGISRGITLIVGGGFHGKSTLLEALQTGIYNKVPGDGRELVVSDPSAVKIRAEDGRRVASVDISPFISNLPFGRSTRSFSSSDASGSTSQATNIQEALEVGCTTLFMDEDTSATNFMVRDARMRELVTEDREPITPFVARVEALSAIGVSSVLVIGGTGEYFQAADRVIEMNCYKAEDVTAKAHLIAEKHSSSCSSNGNEFGEFYPPVPNRTVSTLSSSTGDGGPVSHGGGGGGRGGGTVRYKTHRTQIIQINDEELDLSGVEQLVEKSQTRAVAAALGGWIRRHVGLGGAYRGKPLKEILLKLDEEMDCRGLDALAVGSERCVPGTLARPRLLEVAAAMNRLRSLDIEQISNVV